MLNSWQDSALEKCLNIPKTIDNEYLTLDENYAFYIKQWLHEVQIKTNPSNLKMTDFSSIIHKCASFPTVMRQHHIRQVKGERLYEVTGNLCLVKAAE